MLPIPSIQTFVDEAFESADCSKLFYHSYGHTLSVVKSVEEITEKLQFSTHQQQLLVAAAYWHDIGYLSGYDNHEDRGIELAKTHLPQWQVSNIDIEQICSYIAATKLRTRAASPEAAILADADIFYGIGSSFFDRGPLLRKEWEACKALYYSERDWQQLQLDFLQSVEFQSAYGQECFAPVLQNNIQQQKKLLKQWRN